MGITEEIVKLEKQAEEGRMYKDKYNRLKQGMMSVLSNDKTAVVTFDSVRAALKTTAKTSWNKKSKAAKREWRRLYYQKNRKKICAYQKKYKKMHME